MSAKKQGYSHRSVQGVNFFCHFLRERFCPYGEIKEATPDRIMLEKATPINFEYVVRLAVALSEMAVTISSNATILIDETGLSFLQWLRLYDPKGKPYKSGTTLVGVKLRSPFTDDYNYQDILMNVPHRYVDELKHEKHDLPLAIRHFATAVTLRPELWTNETAVREHFSLMGNRDDYVIHS